MARLLRFYAIDPARALDLPVWLIEQLEMAIDPLEAQETLQAIHIASVPHMKPHERRRLVRRLRRRADPFPRERAEQPVERDPEKAAAYFQSLGIRVVE